MLEQFTLLAKSLKGRAVVGVIQQALASKRIFVFGELLRMPNVQALKGSDQEPYLKLLEVFCFGRCSEYRSLSLPALSEAQSQKLRLLSVLSLCRERRELAYEVLSEEIGAESTRELEDVLIEAIYLGLVSGKMDQRARIFRVSRAASRDVKIGDVSTLRKHLEQWAQTAAALSAALEENRQIGSDARQAEAHHSKAFSTAVDDLEFSLKDQPNLPGQTSAYDAYGLNDRLSSRRVKRSRALPFK